MIKKNTLKLFIKNVNWDNAIIYMSIFTGGYLLGLMLMGFTMLGMTMGFGIIEEFILHTTWVLAVLFVILYILKHVKAKLLRKENVEKDCTAKKNNIQGEK